jgi:transcriptional regulator with XRE-family HTH domain
MGNRDTKRAQTLIGRAVRALREQRGLTLEQLAPLAGISYQYLSGLENGRQNFSIRVLDALAAVLRLPLPALVRAAYDTGGAAQAPRVDPAHFRRAVPLPGALTFDMLEAALNRTQEVFFLINRNMLAEVGRPLQDLIQGNNFSGLVSNVFSDAMDGHTVFKHNHAQRYPDLVCAKTGEGLEVKATIQIGKGGESHNGHSGWHTVICFASTPQGIEFLHVMFAVLRGHNEAKPDWKYVGSRVNEDTGSRRTETYNTTLTGTTKLRDGSAFLDPQRVDFSRWRQERRGAVPAYSIFADAAGLAASRPARRSTGGARSSG